MSTDASPNPSSSPSPPPSEPSIEDILSEATRGLLFTSETDAPLVPFFWPVEVEEPGENLVEEAEVSIESVARAASLPEGAKIERQSVEEFLAPAASEEGWQDEDERATARRFQHLARVLREHLVGAAAFRVGEVEVDVLVVGRAPGGLAGVRTKVVET